MDWSVAFEAISVIVLLPVLFVLRPDDDPDRNISSQHTIMKLMAVNKWSHPANHMRCFEIISPMSNFLVRAAKKAPKNSSLASSLLYSNPEYSVLPSPGVLGTGFVAHVADS